MAQAVKKKDIPRQPMPEQAPEDRITNFNEVPYGFTEELAVLDDHNRRSGSHDKQIIADPHRKVQHGK